MITKIDKILNELSFRVSDGMPDFTNEQHLIKLYEVLKDFGWPADARIELIKTITEAGDTYSGIKGNPPKGKRTANPSPPPKYKYTYGKGASPGDTKDKKEKPTTPDDSTDISDNKLM